MSNPIGWTDQTWNPSTGCHKVSPGCAACYAEGVAKRFWKGRRFEEVEIHGDRIDQPRRWRKPRRVFVNSMSDLFHENLPLWFHMKVFKVMEETPQHQYQILTKRADRMAEYWRREGEWRAELPHESPWPLPNVWLGVSVENQVCARERIPYLVNTDPRPAVRFLSCEPLLGPLDLRPFLEARPAPLDWIICGGESGPGARPCHLEHIRDIVEVCHEFGIACYVKQLGTQAMLDGRPYPHGRGKRDSIDDFPEFFQVRQFPI